MLDEEEIVARLLEELADLEEIRGTDYKPRAYRRAVRNIRQLDEPLTRLHAEDRIGEIEGVGDAIEGKIVQALETGSIDTLERIREEVPVDVRTLGKIRGVGPAKLAKLYAQLDVTTLDELEAAVEAGRVQEIAGFGPKTEAKIEAQIDRVRRASKRWLSAELEEAAQRLASELEDRPGLERVSVAGGLRRHLPLVEGVTLVAQARDVEEALDSFCGIEQAGEVLGRSARRAEIELAHGPPVELVTTGPAGHGAAVLTHTGSGEHIRQLQQVAEERDLTFGDRGLETAEGKLAAQTERGIYDAMDLPYVEPELREGTGEIQAAQEDALPDLVELDDVRGDLQMHTHYSDGATTVQAMAEKADELGYEYILLTDHGPSLSVANAPSIDELSDQGDEVEETNTAQGTDVTVLHGVEANILEDGIDVPEEVCQQLDLVVASLHDNVDDATDRVVQALEDYTVDVFGHPTNRRLTQREGNDLDMDRIVEAAKANDVAIEINAQPDRLDLDWQDVRRFKGEVDFVVSTDAHSPTGMEQMVYGVRQARKGWLEPDDVANAQPLDELLERLGRG